MGLIWSMQPTGPDPAGAYFRDDAAPLRFTVTASALGSQVGSTSFQRRFSTPALVDQTESLKTDGFIGQFWHPVAASARRPAILVIGGSSGGLPGVLLPASLASNGYPALGVAYFKEPDLPQTLSEIPLEYFAQALRWLARQPGVDPTRIAVLGISRGSEAAQLLGVYYPILVHAVVAAVPSDVAICSYPGCTGPAWTLDGRAVPYTSEFDNPSPTDDPAAVIPDQRIQGRCSWTAPGPTRSGLHARTPKRSSGSSTPITITGSMCCTPIRAQTTSSGCLSRTSLTRPQPWRRLPATQQTSKPSHECGPTCSASSPDSPPALRREPSPRAGTVSEPQKRSPPT